MARIVQPPPPIIPPGTEIYGGPGKTGQPPFVPQTLQVVVVNKIRPPTLRAVYCAAPARTGEGPTPPLHIL